VKRRSLTDAERHAMLERQGGLCAARDCMSEGPFIAEHWVPVALGNEEKPDCLLCEACAHKKSFGLRGDISNIAKAKRLSGETSSQWSRRQLHCSSLRSAGFR